MDSDDTSQVGCGLMVIFILLYTRTKSAGNRSFECGEYIRKFGFIVKMLYKLWV